MSTHVPRKAITPAAVRARKGGEPLVCLTAYTTPMARLVDGHADVILVGDSLGMVVHGLPSTVGVTTEMMILHGKAVRRGSEAALLVVDLPFGAYEASPAQAFETAARVMAETGCAAVKLEGGETMAETIAFLTARSVPVMAHVGLMPQQVNVTGGYRVQGRGEDAERVLADARAVEAAGAFSVVLECVPAAVAQAVTERLSIPTIGIGAGAGCDGQVLVWQDAFGLRTGRMAKFDKQYADVHGVLLDAARAYADDVKAGTFPGPEHTF